MTELDPLHLQKLPAHVPLEEPGDDGLPPFYLVAQHHLIDQDATGVGIRPYLPEPDLVRSIEIDGVHFGHEDHLPTTPIVNAVTHELIIARALSTVMSDGAAAVAAGAAVPMQLAAQDRLRPR